MTDYRSLVIFQDTAMTKKFFPSSDKWYFLLLLLPSWSFKDPRFGLWVPPTPRRGRGSCRKCCSFSAPAQPLLLSCYSAVWKFPLLEQIYSIWIMSWISSRIIRLWVAFACRLFLHSLCVGLRIPAHRKWIHLQSITGCLMFLLGRAEMCAFHPIILIHQFQLIWFCSFSFSSSILMLLLTRILLLMVLENNMSFQPLPVFLWFHLS